MLHLELTFDGEPPDAERLGRELLALASFRDHVDSRGAAEELAAMLFGVHPMIEQLRLSVEADGEVPVVWEATRAEVRWEREGTVFGYVDILLENEEAGLYLLHVEPGAEIPRHHHQLMSELEWYVRGDLMRDGDKLIDMAPVRWPRGQIHGYRNVGSEVATVFCCDSPPFIQSDEVYEQAAKAGQAR
jgi:quercetin dioxygenase-like cupin family protein